MQTKEIEARLRKMEPSVNRLVQEIQNAKVQENQYYNHAAQFENAAQQLLNNISYSADEDDGGRAEMLANRASAYMTQASQCRSMAERIRMQIASKQNELRGYRTQYSTFIQEGNSNIAQLNLAVSKLNGLSRLSYGTSLGEVTKQINERLAYNKNLISGCQQRIRLIDSICGSAIGRDERER